MAESTRTDLWSTTFPRVRLVRAAQDDADAGARVFTLVERASGRDLGAAVVRLSSGPLTTADLGLTLHRPDRDLAVDAVRALAGWSFRRGTARAQLRCPLDDLDLARAALGAGFRYEGVQRCSVVTARGPADGAVFARLPGDGAEPIAPALPDLPRGGIGDGVLTLRVATAADAVALHLEQSNAEARRWSLSDPVPASETAAGAERATLEWVVGSRALLAIVDDETGQVAGKVVLRPVVPPGVADVGVGVLPAFRGRRYMARALRIVTDWAFTEGGYARLEAGVKVANASSSRGLVAAGWQFEGQRRSRLRNRDGTFTDELHYAIVHPHHR